MNENAAVIDVTGLMENPQTFKKLLIDQIRARGGRRRWIPNPSCRV